MTRIPHSLASLFLLFAILAVPMMTLPGCGGGDRYDCDSCGDSKEDNPDETDSEDPAEILPLSFIEAADFSVIDATDATALDDFDNFYDIDLRVGTIAEASATEYDEDNDGANISAVSAERWDDTVQKLAWTDATSSLSDSKQRKYYLLTSTGWELKTDTNNHELRRYDDKVYEFWLGVTIKWEIYEAKDRQNSNGVNYPSIAGKAMDEILVDPAFVPPILSNTDALNSVLLWGDNQRFSDTTDAEAKIFVVYKQYRPITLDKAETDTTIEEAGYLAFAPALADENATAFVFRPISATTQPELFKAAFAGDTSAARFAIVENRLYASFVINSTPGAGGAGVMLWSSKQATISDGTADYEEVNTTNGSYIRITLTGEQKAAYGLETYENPMIAFVEEQVNDGINNGAHLGWYYIPSSTLDIDKPQPHYAFNAAAISNIKSAFSEWRKERYCDDSSHNDDTGRDTICSSVTTTP